MRVFASFLRCFSLTAIRRFRIRHLQVSAVQNGVSDLRQQHFASDFASRVCEVRQSRFGCTLFRGDVFRDAVFTEPQQPHVDFAAAVYERLKRSNLPAKVYWDSEYQHLGNDTRPIMNRDHCPQSSASALV